MIDGLPEWLLARLDEDIEHARWSGNALITHGAPSMNIPIEVAERRARLQVNAAEAQKTLFEKTVLPYLGTAGPTGRIAEQQARLMASMHEGHEGYLDSWRP
ncbi:DUF6221 family protein [Streptomyces sp. STCH 565 A]|uniref:DUF6221 family protein n=1 Tax=Streptomyces sp. STCH 565 A TaxID=2950532 RepID=UPI002075DBCD|nr:DUF6221 family protein [Streptomyces sp. STCH 565 A]MCM8552295.1 DUF6221 family protein [Streptomyces sp. STCH 565 A]